MPWSQRSREDQLAGLLGDENPQVRQLGERAAAYRVMKRNGSLEAAIAALYGKQLQLQAQVQTLQNQLSEVRNWTPLKLHRRVVPPVRKFAQDLIRKLGKPICRDSRRPVLPSRIHPDALPRGGHSIARGNDCRGGRIDDFALDRGLRQNADEARGVFTDV